MVPMSLRTTAALAVALACTGVLGGNVQAPAIVLPANAAKNQQAVVDIFDDCWDAYMYTCLFKMYNIVHSSGDRCFIQEICIPA